MHAITRVGAIPLGLVLALSGVALPATAAPAPTTSPATSPTAAVRAAGVRAVTLITGDRVRVDQRGGITSIEPAAGRRHVGFTTITTGGRLLVLPGDAVALISAGKVDRRLFDVKALLEAGYDDARRGDLPLIVRYAGAQPSSPSLAAGLKVTRRLPALRGASLNADKDNGGPAVWASLNGTTPQAGIKAQSAAVIERVWLDGRVRASLDKSTAQIGAPAAWKAGLSGNGIKVAVLDTGVDQTHPDLAGRESTERNFTDSADAVDRFGHGTHVASIIAGTGAKSGGRYRGVAAGAEILDYKVLNDAGYGQESWIIAAMWAAAEQNARVVNLSLGASDTEGVDPMEEAVNAISARHGALFVVAAGNDGPGAQTLGTPGTADAALTVGAVGRDDAIAAFSSRGPRRGDGAVKPDITAPGVGIVAAKAAQGTIGAPATDGYVALNGTSMATPHVAGAAALLAQQHPGWNGGQLKSALTASARFHESTDLFAQGAGRVDVAAAMAQRVLSEPAAITYGTQAWPHDDDEPVAKTVTYRNTGTDAVTLDLSLAAKGPDGKAAPAGMFTVTPARLTVPAGATATATVTANTRPGTVDGLFTGTLTAAGGSGGTIRTPLSIMREVAHHDLTLNHIGRYGSRPNLQSTTLLSLDTGKWYAVPGREQSTTMRLPVGRYVIDAALYDRTVDDKGNDVTPVTKLIYPELTLRSDQSITLDARQGKPIMLSPPDPSAAFSYGLLRHERVAGGHRIGGWHLYDGLMPMFTAQLGTNPTVGTLQSGASATWTTPAPGPKIYNLVSHRKGSLFTGLNRSFTWHELARVAVHAAATRISGMKAVVGSTAYTSDGFVLGGGAREAVSAPADTTFFIAAGGLSWRWYYQQDWADGNGTVLELLSDLKTYRGGRHYRYRMNSPVYGPAVLDEPGYGFERDGDRLNVRVPLLGDADGNAGGTFFPPGTTTLYRNGREYGQFKEPGTGVFVLSPDTATYRLSTEASQYTEVSDTATIVKATWTFRSAETTRIRKLPLSVIRFHPSLDAANSAPAGRRFAFPISVHHVPGDGSGRLRKLTVDVSYNGGTTWSKARLYGKWVVLTHPAKATTVSLRAKATDTRGNTVEQTILPAYKLR